MLRNQAWTSAMVIGRMEILPDLGKPIAFENFVKLCKALFTRR